MCLKYGPLKGSIWGLLGTLLGVILGHRLATSSGVVLGQFGALLGVVLGQFWASKLSSWSLVGVKFGSCACGLFVSVCVCLCSCACVGVCPRLLAYVCGCPAPPPRRASAASAASAASRASEATQRRWICCRRAPMSVCASASPCLCLLVVCVVGALCRRAPMSVCVAASLCLCLWVRRGSQKLRDVASTHLKLALLKRASRSLSNAGFEITRLSPAFV